MSSQDGLPPSSRDGSNRVFRGGSWYGRPQVARVAFRYDNAPGIRLNSLGVRLVEEPAEEEPPSSRDGSARVILGSSWYKHPQFARAAARGSSAPGNRYTSFGVRLVEED